MGATLALTDSSENVTDTCRYFPFADSLTGNGTTVNNLRFVDNPGYYNEAAPFGLFKPYDHSESDTLIWCAICGVDRY